MSTLKELISISKIEIEDPKDRLLKELAILEHQTVASIKRLSMEQIDNLVYKYRYLYSKEEEIKPIRQFYLDGKLYDLPVTLRGKSYGYWETLETIGSNDVFGETTWEKLPYYLYILTYKGDVNNDPDCLANIMTDGVKFLNISISDALGLSSFFLELEKPLLSNLTLFMKMTVQSLLQIK